MYLVLPENNSVFLVEKNDRRSLSNLFLELKQDIQLILLNPLYRLILSSSAGQLLIGVPIEAYSAAGKTWFGWWLVEHYFSYHVDCPDGCDSGEPARGRKDPPYFQMSYGSLDNIPDLVDPLVESPLPVQ